MKLRYHLLPLLSALLFAAPACTEEAHTDMQSEEVTIQISTDDPKAKTRGEGDPIDPLYPDSPYKDDPDFRIGTLRVLIYHESNGTLYLKTERFTPPDNPQSVTLKTGRYHFVFIANEDLDGTLSAKLEALAIGSPFSEIAALTIDGSAFNSKIMSGMNEPGEEDTLIPKVAVRGSVLVSKRSGQVMIIESDGTTINNSQDNWVVALTQAGVRIDLELALTDLQLALYNGGKLSLSLSNVPDHVDLLGKYNYTAAQTIARVLGEGTISGKTVTWSRIVLPETFFADRTNRGNGVVLTATLDGRNYTTVLGSDLSIESRDYTIRRGIWLKIQSARIAQAEEIILTKVTVQDWDAIDGGETELIQEREEEL